MNTPIFVREMDAGEQRRRKASQARAARLLRAFGFRTVAGRPGHWYHPEIDPSVIYDFAANPPADAGDVLDQVFFRGLMLGQEHAQTRIKQALGL